MSNIQTACEGKTMSDSIYSEKSIVELTPREHIRRRPGMYIGGKDSRALHMMVFELLGNPLAQAILGRVKHVSVILEDEARITVSDDGYGIPATIDSELGEIPLERILTTMERQNLIRDNVPVFIHGEWIGLVPINVLSSALEITVKWDGRVWHQLYHQGIAQTLVTQIREMVDGETTGTSITLTPDFEIFEPNLFDFWRLAESLREQAYLTKGVKITLEDRRSAPYERQNIIFHFPDGLMSYLKDKDYTFSHFVSSTLIETISMQFGDYEIGAYCNRTGYLEIGIKYTDANIPSISTVFINGLCSRYLGIETQAFTQALFAFFKTNLSVLFNPEMGRKPRLTEKSVGRGFVIVFNINHPNPIFARNIASELINPELYPLIYDTTLRLLNRMMDTHRDVLEDIARRL